jgi:hypothetical protein
MTLICTPVCSGLLHDIHNFSSGNTEMFCVSILKDASIVIDSQNH